MAENKKISKIAWRYGRALLSSVERELGREGSPTPAQSVAVELQGLAHTWETHPELSTYCLTPFFPREERHAALGKVVEHLALSHVLQRFVRVIAERDRLSLIPEISYAFSELADRQAGVILVEVTVSAELGKLERDELEQALRTSIGHQPVFRWQVEPEILGGMIVRYEGRVFDASVRGRLNRLEQTLLS